MEIQQIEENNFFNKYITGGLATKKGMSLSNATAFLSKADTLHMYYKTNLNNIRRATTQSQKDRCLKSIKKIGDKWRLKLQCSKYAHPLFVDDANNEYDAFWFDSETEAQQGMDDWIEQLRNKERGVLRAIEQAYARYCDNNKITFDADFFETETMEVA